MAHADKRAHNGNSDSPAESLPSRTYDAAALGGGLSRIGGSDLTRKASDREIGLVSSITDDFRTVPPIRGPVVRGAVQFGSIQRNRTAVINTSTPH